MVAIFDKLSCCWPFWMLKILGSESFTRWLISLVLEIVLELELALVLVLEIELELALVLHIER